MSGGRRRAGRFFWLIPLLAAITGVSTPIADAQFLRLTPLGEGETGELTKEDFALYHVVARNLLDGDAAPGTFESWENSESGNSGTVGLVSVFDYGGMPCKTLRVRLHFRSPDPHDSYPYALNYCRIATGEWKLFG
jgi:hypothetical protein